MEKVASPHRLLDSKAIQRAEMLGLQARTVVEGYMAGNHKSPFRGFAIEFSQHREYVPGDDIRHLDWKVLGKTDRYYIKQYEQETNYVAHILLDGSESMQYGSGKITKMEYGRVMAATLAYLILLQRDAISMMTFDERVRDYQPRTDSLGKIHQIMSVLSAFEPTAETRIGQVLHDLARQTKRKGIVILISDLFDNEDEILDGIQHLRFDGHEVIVFQVIDPKEKEFPFQGTVEFIGYEKMPKILTRPHEIKKTYLKNFNDFLDRIRLGCERNRCHHTLVDTSHPWHEVLSGYLAMRQKIR